MTCHAHSCVDYADEQIKKSHRNSMHNNQKTLYLYFYINCEHIENCITNTLVVIKLHTQMVQSLI